MEREEIRQLFLQFLANFVDARSFDFYFPNHLLPNEATGKDKNDEPENYSADSGESITLAPMRYRELEK